MKTLLTSTCLTVAFLAGGQAAMAQDCGDVTIASMNWQSAEVLSNLDRFILNEGYGCRAEITIGDTVPTLTSISEKGQPDIAPEAWVDLLPEIVNRGVDEGRTKKVGDPLPDGGVQGWYIPKYFADAHPEIKTVADALAHPEMFPDQEDPSKGAILNGPQGWGGTIVTSQWFKALDGEGKGFKLVDTGSAAGLDGAIARAYEREQGFIAFYWAPTALLGRYPMVRLEDGVAEDPAEWKRCITVEDCPDPKFVGWPKDTVVTLVATSFADRVSPEVMEYLDKRSWSNEFVNGLMAWMTDNQATGEDGARHFLKENAEMWKAWVTPDAAAKIEAAL